MTEPVVPNLLSVPPGPLRDELMTDLLVRPGCRVERIVSLGHVTPPDHPYIQAWDEWVLLLRGAARIRMEGREHALAPGDHLLIPANTPHWVTFTDPAAPTVWLALHFD